MKRFVAFAFLAMLLAAPALASAQGNGCTFPGVGWGVGGTPPTETGTFPGNGTFPGGNCNGGASVTASEPATLALIGVGLLGARLLLKRRRD